MNRMTTLAVLLVISLQTGATSADRTTDRKAPKPLTVPDLARAYRVQAYMTHQHDRDAYQKHRKAADEMLRQWRAAGSPETPATAAWFQGARAAVLAGGPPPQMPDFSQFQSESIVKSTPAPIAHPASVVKTAPVARPAPVMPAAIKRPARVEEPQPEPQPAEPITEEPTTEELANEPATAEEPQAVEAPSTESAPMLESESDAIVTAPQLPTEVTPELAASEPEIAEPATSESAPPEVSFSDESPAAPIVNLDELFETKESDIVATPEPVESQESSSMLPPAMLQPEPATTEVAPVTPAATTTETTHPEPTVAAEPQASAAPANSTNWVYKMILRFVMPANK